MYREMDCAGFVETMFSSWESVGARAGVGAEGHEPSSRISRGAIRSGGPDDGHELLLGELPDPAFKAESSADPRWIAGNSGRFWSASI